LGRGHVAVLAEHGVDEIAVAVDGPIEIGPAAADLQVRLVHVPAATAGTAPAVPALTKVVGKKWCELRLPRADGLVTEDDPADEEHLAEVAQGQAVAQSPQHHERDDVGRVLGVVQHGAGALVVLLAAVAAAEPAVALGGALRPLGHHGRAAGHTVHPRPPRRALSRSLPALPRPAKPAAWRKT
jgi:hypothetical protein